jgi:tetratricopeptide (TPR) repeat protein
VVFPLGKDVIVTVYYDQPAEQGEIKSNSNYFKYAYLLETGAAWKDTIGSADIIFRVPNELNAMTLPHFEPEGALVSTHEIHWHFENFEPSLNDGTGQVAVNLMAPEYDFRIQEAEKYLATHPEDGKAWGQVGKAYKEAGIGEFGFRRDAAGDVMFQKSAAAYQKVVDLLPEDADWHYGYADLLCTDAVLTTRGRWMEEYTAQIYACFRELERALELNPANKDAQT